jgi:cell division protein FtsB
MMLVAALLLSAPVAAWVTPSQVATNRMTTALHSSLEQEAEKLKEQARILRDEIENFEKKKDAMKEEERQKIKNELDEREAYIEKYSAVIPILKPDGKTVEERVQFPPRLKDQDSNIIVCEAYLPLGIILGESETQAGMTVVDEVAEGSNGGASGVQVGDIVRAFTACRVEMDLPLWQVIAGGIGRPKTMRFVYGSDVKPFEQVMEAIGSNRMDPEGRPVMIVIERAS